jgi:hypothetical protein
MPRRKIKLNTKVAAMRASLRLTNVAEIVRKDRLSKQSLYNWYQRILDAWPDILADAPPGPKPKDHGNAAPPF